MTILNLERKDVWPLVHVDVMIGPKYNDWTGSGNFGDPICIYVYMYTCIYNYVYAQLYFKFVHIIKPLAIISENIYYWLLFSQSINLVGTNK